jgi:hypothetical protein
MHTTCMFWSKGRYRFLVSDGKKKKMKNSTCEGPNKSNKNNFMHGRETIPLRKNPYSSGRRSHDDIIALATLLCSLGPEYSRNFWTREETTGSLIPHRTLQKLELIQTKDDSLLPSYLSWLAALVNDEASVNAIHAILSRVEDDGTSNRRAKVTWTTLIFNLRWYAHELSPYMTPMSSRNPLQQTTTRRPPKVPRITTIWKAMPFPRQAAPTAPRIIILLIRMAVLVKPRPPPPPHRLPALPTVVNPVNCPILLDSDSHRISQSL